MKGHFYQNKQSGRWYARVDAGRKPNGRRQQLHFNGRTKRDVELQVARAIADAERGVSYVRSKMTVGELLDKWFAVRKDELRLRTRLSYEDQIRLYLKPSLGGIAVHHLTSGQIQEAIDAWRIAPRFDNKPGRRGARTIRLPVGVLSQALAYGVTLGVCLQDQTKYVMLPRAVRPDPVDIDTARAGFLLKGLIGSDEFVEAWTLMATGMRRSELLGLIWNNVDLDAGIISVQKGYIQRKGQVEYLTVKSRKSRRQIPITSITVELLRKHRAAQGRRLETLGISDAGNVPVFDDGFGGHRNPDSFGSAFRSALRKHGIPHLKMHGTRHAFSNVARDEAVERKIVSDILGHESTAFTDDFYTKTKIATLRRGAEAVADALYNYIAGESVKTVDVRTLQESPGQPD